MWKHLWGASPILKDPPSQPKQFKDLLPTSQNQTLLDTLIFFEFISMTSVNPVVESGEHTEVNNDRILTWWFSWWVFDIIKKQYKCKVS